MKNVLVTGGAGFIGCNFVRYLLLNEPDVRVINLDALTYAGSLENLADLPDPERHTFIQGDICDQRLTDELMAQYNIDTVVHFAAESHVDRSILGPTPFIQTNVVGTSVLLESARSFWETEGLLPAKRVRFHHISTDEVYGSLEASDPPFSESTPYSPNSPYAASKASSDHLVRAYAHTYGVPVTITNCSNNYGPYQFPEKLISLSILNALSGEALPIYGDGQQIRDWLHVEDHCEAVWLVLKDGGLGETYNVGGNNQPTNLEIVRTLCAVLDQKAPNSGHAPHASLITFVADRPGHDRRYAMDTGKIRRELGWRPRYDLESGLERTVEWYLDNPRWIEAIKNRPTYSEWMEANYRAREELR